MSSHRPRLRRPFPLALVIYLGLLAGGPAAGQLPAPAAAAEPAPPAEQADAEPAPQVEPGDRSTPRGTVLGYLQAAREGDWERAASYLNLSPVPQPERARRGPELARELKTVLDRELWVEPDLLSAKPAGNPDDGLPARRDRVGTIETGSGPVDVLAERVTEPGGVRVWQISAATVAKIPALYEEFGYGALGELLPSFFFESQLLEIQLWQWVALLCLLLVAWLVSWAVVRVLVAVVRPAVSRSSTELDDRLLEAVVGPARLTVGIVLFRVGLVPLGLALPAERFLVASTKALSLVAVAWLLLRAIDFLAELARGRLEEREQREVIRFVPLGRKTVKVFVVVMAVLAGLDSFGFDVTTLLAGLGIGGLAVALALQKTLENLFGGATLIADRPVQVGDFCRFADKIGTVEEIGLRSTRVRTLDRTVVTIPNADFSTMQLENFAKRDRIWYHPTLGLRYETTPEQMRYVLVEIRKLLYSHPRVDPDPARIRFTKFGAYSLDLEIFAYVLATDFGEYLEIAEDLNLRIMDVVDAAGTGFAFPSSTTYLAKDDGLDAERAGDAEAAVKEWREANELCLPGFPQERIQELKGSLPYPPEGSAIG